ncbi:MAG: toxin HicA [Desulfosarcina sp.]|nr:toxin HicA [Desulfosarcina sp.]MBC2745017.1 toxin HicA [Desulfosarcina sp.]MBC2767925.1 toxin HicA [Desulfosarcina sp.]
MKNMHEKLKQLKNNPKDVKFADLSKVCEFYFGKPRQSGSSHRIFKTPWQGDPRVNIQNHKGKAKVYQVKQVLKAIERLEVEHGTKE